MPGRNLILVADDNPGTLYATSRILRGAGYTVLEATTGEQALAFSGQRPDLVLLDINMPDMSGYEVCAQLRTIPAAARIPILHLSATLIEVSDKVRGLNAGADAYLTHPVEPEILVATVRAFLRAKDSEEAFRQSDARYRAVFENALNGIALLDEAETISDVNPAMCSILGVEREELIGQWLPSFASDEVRDDLSLILRVARQSGSWQGRFPLSARNGLVQLDWAIASGPMNGYDLVIVTDVTAEVAIEAERRALLKSEMIARKEAENANRLKDEFLATLSHELRTPLTAILGWSQILKLGCPPSKAEEGLDAIVRNSLAQSQLISDLLDVSRITSGKIKLEVEEVDIWDVVSDAISTVSHAAQAKGIQIVKNDAIPIPKVTVDRGRFVQIIWNLLSNSVRFTPAGGSITISIAAGDNQVVIKLADTGEGIDPEFLPFLFDRFRQADSATTRQHSGLGLGLSIVKHLVELHGGSVSAFSEGAGKGTTMALTIPSDGKSLVNQEPCAEDKPASRVASNFGTARRDLTGAKVMLVEDNDDSRDLVSYILRNANANVLAVGDAERFFEEFEEYSPDVLISDIAMPKKDGFQIMRELRETWPDKSFPSIALTAFASLEDSKRMLDAGFDTYLTKPVEPADLVNVVGELLEARKSSQG